MQIARITAVLMLLTLVPLSACGQQVDKGHPLDPMSWREYWVVLETLRGNKHLDADTRFSLVHLQEPEKQAVQNWSPASQPVRVAYAIVRQGTDSYKGTVDLVDGKLVSWEKLEGVQPSWLLEEFTAVSDVVKEHPDFLKAMKDRGIKDLSFIEMYAVPPGNFGEAEYKGKRIAFCNCVDVRRKRNIWPSGIAGLTVVVDMNSKEVLRVVDEGVVPFADTSADYDQASIGKPRQVPGPIHINRPLGTGFKVDGYRVQWQNWSFHVRPDQRVGLVISEVRYKDKGEYRDVMYQGHLSEMFVPYMDPAFAWYARNFLDAGEYPVGGIAKPLQPGLDCPPDTHYIDSIVADDLGRPKVVSKTVGIFERYDGDMSWRHVDEEGRIESESRPKRDLVVRHADVVGNYDYVVDWVFQQNGSIRVAVGATGIVEAKQVAPKSARESRHEKSAADEYGRFVDDHIVAVNHDHYFSFRLDLDVDGRNNSLLVDRLMPKALPEDHPRRSVWVREPFTPERESNAQMKMMMNRPSLWRIVSTSKTNRVGYPTSYQVMPGHNSVTLLSADDYPRRRAGFIDNHLWVTPYRVNERYAAGDFPTLSEPGQGLPAWTSQDRPVNDTDIVVWYTMGMHHLVRTEDWPVMPVSWHSFEIRPFDFFDRNPALDLPRKP